MTLTQFVNQTEMNSLSGFLRAIGWITVVWAFTFVACKLLLSGNEKLVAWGFQLSIAILGGLGFASTVGAYNTKTVRQTSREYVEAKGKADAANGKGAPAIVAEKVEKVEVGERPRA